MADTRENDAYPSGVFGPDDVPFTVQMGSYSLGYLRRLANGFAVEDQDWLRFAVEAGQRYRIEVRPLVDDPDDFSLFGTVYDASNLSNSLASQSSNDADRLRFLLTAESDGFHYLQIEPSAFSPTDEGAYEVLVWLRDDERPVPPDIVVAPDVAAPRAYAGGAREAEIDLHYYSVIYDALDEVKKAITGVLGTEPKPSDTIVMQNLGYFQLKAPMPFSACLRHGIKMTSINRLHSPLVCCVCCVCCVVLCLLFVLCTVMVALPRRNSKPLRAARRLSCALLSRLFVMQSLLCCPSAH